MAILSGTCVACGSSGSGQGSPAATDPADEAAAQEAWRETISHLPTPEEGCFQASYPSTTWEETGCTAAPAILDIRPPASRNTAAVPFTVGNGNDFAAQTTGKVAKSSGSFPKVTGVTSESDGTKNTYSIQLNSNFMSGTAACKGVAGCLSWSQFVYSTSQQSAFVQDWLIGIGTCPDSTFFSDGQGDCFKNSAAVAVPVVPISKLSTIKMTGSAVAGHTDTLIFAAEGQAFRTSQRDSITNLGTAWTAAEYNIIGDGGASEAVFNKGSSISVRIGLNDGTTNPPACVPNDGTTGETNNLNLGKCTTGVGTTPFIEFTESL